MINRLSHVDRSVTDDKASRMALSAALMFHLGPKSIALLVLIDYQLSISTISDQKVTVIHVSRLVVPATQMDPLSPRTGLLSEKIDQID